MSTRDGTIAKRRRRSEREEEEREEKKKKKTNKKRMRRWSSSPADLIDSIDGMGVVVEVRTSARQKCLHYMT